MARKESDGSEVINLKKLESEAFCKGKIFLKNYFFLISQKTIFATAKNDCFFLKLGQILQCFKKKSLKLG